MSEELTSILLCDKLGWTYDEYLSQPLWFIKAILAKLDIEAEHFNKKLKK